MCRLGTVPFGKLSSTLSNSILAFDVRCDNSDGSRRVSGIIYILRGSAQLGSAEISRIS